MARKSEIRKCKGCGEDVFIVRTGTAYKNVVVDAEEVWIRMESGGELFFTVDGEPKYGHQAGDADDDPDSNLIPVYAPHLGHCPNNGRKPRKRRRPSGYR